MHLLSCGSILVGANSLPKCLAVLLSSLQAVLQVPSQFRNLDVSGAIKHVRPLLELTERRYFHHYCLHNASEGVVGVAIMSNDGVFSEQNTGFAGWKEYSANHSKTHLIWVLL